MMHVELTQIIDCSGIGSGECTERALTALGNSPEFNLRARSEDATVHGSITIVHDSPPEPHLISVEIYEANVSAEPEDGGRKSTLARPTIFPTERQINDRLTKWVN